MSLALHSPPPIEATSFEAAPAAERYLDATAMLTTLSLDLVVGEKRVFVRAPDATAEEKTMAGLASDDVDTVAEALGVLSDRLRQKDDRLAAILFRLFETARDEQVRANVLRVLFTGQLAVAHDAKLFGVMDSALQSPSEETVLASISAAAYLSAGRKRAFSERASRARSTMSSRLLRALRAFEATLS